MNKITYSISDFINTSKSKWLNLLKSHVTEVMSDIPGDSQVRAWDDCYNVLQNEFRKMDFHDKTYFIFEYPLHRERGRRPDVLLLTGETLYVLEFKQHNLPDQAQVDQAYAYARDLAHYHLATHMLTVEVLLILTGATNYERKSENVLILSSDKLSTFFSSKLNQPFCQNSTDWCKSSYEPLPSILTAEKLFFESEKLPQIKRALSAEIPTTLAAIHNIIDNKNQVSTHNLILITGVPGAGKTLVGLNYVHSEKNKKASFLSGNGPLVNVLQATLKGKSLVQGLLGFKKTYSDLSQKPREDVIVFDEAQRAWGHKRMRGNFSEPEVLIRIAETKENFTIIALIGEGQEIHVGEEDGLVLWEKAVNTIATKNWNIYGPEKLAPVFSKNYHVTDNLDLTVSLRTHTAENLQFFVNSIFLNNLKSAKSALVSLYKEGYQLYLTRDLEQAKSYVQRRYHNEEDKSFGLISSSKGEYLKRKNNLRKGFSNEVNYFVKQSCKDLQECATEFACQGLELDFPIVCWDDDLIHNQQWYFNDPKSQAENPLQLRLNTYRVLLTRGRDGMFIYIPNHQHFNSTYDLFLELGVKTRNS